MITRSVLLSLVCVALAATATRAEVYEVKGVIVALRPETQSAVIRHEEIPNVMPAMTMPFSVPDKEEFSGLSVNDEVRFEFVMETSGSYARAFEVLGTVEPTNTPDARRPRVSEKLESGASVPTYKLIDQDGQPIGLRDENGRLTLLTFIFTRCPVPDFCPLMSAKFGELQRRFDEADLLDEARLLSITIDPKHDSPSVLRDYGKSVGADFEHWSFATADPNVIDQLASDFRVFREQDGARLDHTLCTALIASDGTVLEIWRGNRWETDDALALVSEFLGQN